jgi:hypothetical protein
MMLCRWPIMISPKMFNKPCRPNTCQVDILRGK